MKPFVANMKIEKITLDGYDATVARFHDDAPSWIAVRSGSLRFEMTLGEAKKFAETLLRLTSNQEG